MVYMPLSKFYSLSLLVTRKLSPYPPTIYTDFHFDHFSQRKTRLEFR